MNEALRWVLILGCLLLLALEAPQSSLVLVQDLRGPWRGEQDAAANVAAALTPAAARETSTTPPALKPHGAFASLAPETSLGLERSLPVRLADDLPKSSAAILLAH